MLCETTYVSNATPNNFVPYRSPLITHTFIANLSVQKEVLEIGTRTGQALKCYSKIAKKATAVEIQPDYCAYLRQIPNVHVKCPVNAFHSTRELDADIVSFWIDPSKDVRLLHHLIRLKQQKAIREHARFINFIDHSIPEYRIKMRAFINSSLRTFLKSITVLDFDERQDCETNMKTQKTTYWVSCRRAQGRFSVAVFE
jgi:hypothetical protein